MKLALALIVKGSDSEAALLERCLENLVPYVDGIFITRTHLPGDTPNATVGKVAKRFGAHLSDFEWIDDFASARNYNFEQVDEAFDWIMWTDADDIWRGLEKLRPTLEKHPNTDAFGFWYIYDWDEFKKPVVVHRKTMIVRNDNSTKWIGAIHEDLEPNRHLDTQLVEGIERLHITTEERAKNNAKRNLLISEKEAKEKHLDPRSYWNLANAKFAVSDFTGARDTFKEFIKDSQSSEEIYLAKTRLANVYKSLNQRDFAIQELQSAIGLMPSVPDAYLQLASYYFEFEDMDNAEEYCLQGIVKRPQIMKMVVYNPRDYDYNPMMLLAKIYEAKNRPDLMLPLIKGCLKIYPDDEKLKAFVEETEKNKDLLGKSLKIVSKLQRITDKKKLKIALEKVPDELRSHPMISVFRNTNFIKETSSGRDLVIYCGNTTFTWNPNLFKTKGFGGSEEAVIHMARELAKLGWNVTVYNNCGHKEVTEAFTFIDDPLVDEYEDNYAKIIYKPFWEWNYRDKQDVVIIWRWSKPLDAEINAPKIYLDLHDVISEGELTEKRLNKVTKIFVKSKFHRSLFPNTPNDKFAVIPNGFEIYQDDTIQRDPYLLINTSSPDRSMDVLPKLFIEVKKQVPEAKLAHAYGWDGFTTTHAKDRKKMQWMEETKEAMKVAGIKDLGRITQEEVGKLYQKASIYAYPSEFAEIDCISLRKAQAAGCIPVTTNFAAMKETVDTGVMVRSEKTKDTWNKPYQFHFGLEDEKRQKEWIQSVIDMLKLATSTTSPHINDLRELSKERMENFTWPKIAARWNEILCE